MRTSFFRKECKTTVTTPYDLNEYIRAISSGVWIMLAAVALLIAAVAVWCVTAKLPTVIDAHGIGARDGIYCYIPAENMDTVIAGMKVKLDDGIYGTVNNVGTLPCSKSEVAASIGSDYLASQLNISEWSVPVLVDTPADITIDEIYSVQIVSDEISPIEFLSNKGA